MRNIHELIGIIKGISFDGIINQKEYNRLQAWADKNRNFTYNEQQADLIRLVDQVVEDGVIDADEKQLLLNTVDGFSDEEHDLSSHIYELNGIIEGIICDDVINEDEVYHLKQWMENNENRVRHHEPSKELCAVIDGILEDGVVTKEEQEFLLSVLKEQIKTAQFETKLQYLRQKVKAKENIGIDLITLLDNADAMNEIHRMAEKQLLSALSSYSSTYVKDPEIVFISLVLIGMLNYDASYYDSVAEQYKTLYARYNEPKIEGFIRHLLQRYKTPGMKQTGRNSYIQAALTNALVPSYYLPGFFEFIYDIYKTNFNFGLSNDLEKDFAFIYDGLRTAMLSQGDDIEISVSKNVYGLRDIKEIESNVSRKTYRLISSTKQLILDEDQIGAMIKLSIIIIKLIDKKIWNEKVRILNPYLKQGYDKWSSTVAVDPEFKLIGSHAKELRSRWEPKFELINNKVYQIDAENYVLRNYKKSRYYRCSKCGRLTPHNVHDTCVRDKCDGRLVEVNPDEVLADNYYRNQYTDKKIERIIVKEHTAQLDRKKAKQYQNDFKNKKINILSCSTTFEMGIDIGELETVFMRNVPPTPANYVQRAGRAGRRKDSSAFILTYCGTSSHDYTYFAEPEKMISGVINPPYFNIQNRKIITRHLMATCLGYFFRNNPEYFIKIDQLVFGDGVEKFNSYVSGHPADLVRYIDEKVLPEAAYADYHMLKWFSDMGNKDEKLVLFAEIIRNTEKEYKDAQKAALNEEKYQEADYFKKQIEYLHSEKTIQELSKYCVIPKYGFPVDVVELQIYQDGRLLNKYDLTRDLRIAISEYAPESEIIVDGTKYTSQYITLPKAAPFPKQYFCECENCRSVNVFLSPGEYSTCRYCGESIVSSFAEYFIEPVEGFKTGITKESTRMKPRRTYAGEVSYLGQGIQDDNKLNLNGALFAVTSTDDELLVMNRSKFYSCPVCGYSEVGKRNTTPSIMKGHKNYRQYDCPCDTLNKLKLGHRFRTDVARFTIPLLIHFDKKSYFKALSFLYAFLEGISSYLEIERNDIDGLLTINLDEGCYDVIVYDNVPGGAGHVKRLMSKPVVIGCLKAGLHKVSLDCCDENTSCYSCLRNYYNQQYHAKLQRRYAKEAIRDLLQQII